MPSPNRPPHLALPTSASSSSSTTNSQAKRNPSPPKPRKRKRPRPSQPTGDLTRALDEGDDVSDTELVAADCGSVADSDDDEGGEGDGDHEPRDSRGGGGGGGGGGKRVEIGDRGVAGRAKKRRGETLMLRNVLDVEQGRRFDAFSTAVIPRQAMTRLNRDLFDQRVNANLAAVIAGMAKIFVADIVELAKDLQPHSAYPKGPLRPFHLKLARMRMEEMGMLGGYGGAGLRGGRKLFRR